MDKEDGVFLIDEYIETPSLRHLSLLGEVRKAQSQHRSNEKIRHRDNVELN